MSEHEQRTDDEVAVPDDAVEDLEPGEGDADDVTGGRISPGGGMGWDVKSNTKV